MAIQRTITTFVAVVAFLCVLGLAPCTAASGLHRVSAYDPLALAVDQLTSMGYPPPDGYTVQEVPGGSLGGQRPATTNGSTKTIDVDVAALIGAAEANGDISPDTVVAAVAVVVRHEYHHTPEYGVPTPTPGGYGNGVCAHMDIAEGDIDFVCELICEASDPKTVSTLCQFQNQWIGGYNAALKYRNSKCPGAKNKKFLCGCCS
jgi:hypothetical protein